MAQLVQCWTDTWLMQVRFPNEWQGIFLPESIFSADSLKMSIQPHVRLYALTSVHTLKILQSMSEFDGLWKH